MPAEHPIALDLTASSAFEEAVRSRTVGIVNLVLERAARADSENDTNKFFESVGTGSALRWRDLELLLTAKHVVEGADATDLRFFPRVQGHIEFATTTKPQGPNLPSVSAREEIQVSQIIRCEREDLAAIIFRPGATANYLIDFHELREEVFVPGPGVQVMMIGHPTDSAFEMGKFQVGPGLQQVIRGIYPMLVTSAVQETPSAWQTLKGFEPERHFLIDFAPGEDGREPLGFSGAGVWFYRQGPSSLWFANPRFAGLCTHYYRRRRALKMVRSAEVLKFLCDSLPS
jgi:hypothetical protein